MLDFFSGLFSGLGSVIVEVEQFLAALLSLLIQAFQYLGQLLLQIVNYFIQGIAALFKFLGHIWTWFAKDILGRLLSWAQTAQRWLEQHLRPVINFLKRVRAFVDRWYQLYIRPYLQMIQRIRRYIAILRLLHIHFADWLDKRLAQEEAFVAQTFLRVRGYLNQIIDTVNALTDPPKLVRFIVASISGRRAAAAMSKILTGLPIGHWFPRTSSGAFPWEQPFTSSADYRDPLRNPSAVSLLASLLDSPPLSVDSPDGVPTDDQLNALETVPWGDEYVAALALQEALIDATSGLPYDPITSLLTGKGVVASGTAARGDAFLDAIALT